MSLSHLMLVDLYGFFFFKQKTAYEMRISDWSSDVCSSDLVADAAFIFGRVHPRFHHDFVDGGRDRGRQRDARADRGERHDIAVVPAIAVDLDVHVVEIPLELRVRSEEHTSELQSLMRNSYAVFCLKKKKRKHQLTYNTTTNRDQKPQITKKLKIYPDNNQKTN